MYIKLSEYAKKYNVTYRTAWNRYKAGKRIKRGLFKSKEGILINSDVNGGLNILRKVAPNIFYNGVEVIAVSPKMVTF